MNSTEPTEITLKPRMTRPNTYKYKDTERCIENSLRYYYRKKGFLEDDVQKYLDIHKKRRELKNKMLGIEPTTYEGRFRPLKKIIDPSSSTP